MIRVLRLSLLAALLWTSCSQEKDPCLLPTTAPMRVNSAVKTGDTSFVDAPLTQPAWIAIDSSKGFLFDANSSSFTLLLSPLVDSTRYVVQPDTSLPDKDTITFYYDRNLHFLSTSCGYTYFYSLTNIAYTKHLIDSAYIVNSNVNQNANTAYHVRILF